MPEIPGAVLALSSFNTSSHSSSSIFPSSFLYQASLIHSFGLYTSLHSSDISSNFVFLFLNWFWKCSAKPFKTAFGSVTKLTSSLFCTKYLSSVIFLYDLFNRLVIIRPWSVLIISHLLFTFSSICFLCTYSHSSFLFSLNIHCHSFISSIQASDHCLCSFGNITPTSFPIALSLLFISILSTSSVLVFFLSFALLIIC